MARDYAKQHKPGTRRPKKSNTRKPAAKVSNSPRGWQLYFAGLFSGVFLSFLLYLGTLPPGPGPGTMPQAAQDDSTPAAIEPPKPRFDFYTLLPEQTMDLGVETAEAPAAQTSNPAEFYLLQAGAFKQREDAESRRAQLLLLNLDPKIEETNSDNGRWYRCVE